MEEMLEVLLGALNQRLRAEKLKSISQGKVASLQLKVSKPMPEEPPSISKSRTKHKTVTAKSSRSCLEVEEIERLVVVMVVVELRVSVLRLAANFP